MSNLFIIYLWKKQNIFAIRLVMRKKNSREDTIVFMQNDSPTCFIQVAKKWCSSCYTKASCKFRNPILLNLYAWILLILFMAKLHILVRICQGYSYLSIYCYFRMKVGTNDSVIWRKIAESYQFLTFKATKARKNGIFNFILCSRNKKLIKGVIFNHNRINSKLNL